MQAAGIFCFFARRRVSPIYISLILSVNTYSEPLIICHITTFRLRCLLIFLKPRQRRGTLQPTRFQYFLTFLLDEAPMFTISTYIYVYTPPYILQPLSFIVSHLLERDVAAAATLRFVLRHYSPYAITHRQACWHAYDARFKFDTR